MDTALYSEESDIKRSLSEQAADQITEYIRNKKLKSGDKLPNEFELMKIVQVSRGTLREAVKLLVSRNILEIKRGKGTFVKSKTGQIEDPLGFHFYPDQKKLALDLLELRYLLEPWFAEQAALRASDENLKDLKNACRAVEEDILWERDHLANDVRFHEAIAQCTQNTVAPNLIPFLSYSCENCGLPLRNTLQLETVVDHRDITDAITRHDTEKAKNLMILHLDKYRNELLEILKKDIQSQKVKGKETDKK